jgi:hypothetical protein
MKRSMILMLMAAGLAGLLLVGCSKDSVGPETEAPPVGVSNEQQAMQFAAVNDEFVKNDEETFDDQALEPEDYELVGLTKISADIRPLRFGRFITSVTRTVTVTVQPGDTISVAEVSKDILGVFKVRAINGTGDTVLYEKPFNDKTKRYVVFRRVARDTARYWRNWVPVATSLVNGGTAAPNDRIHITRVDMFLPNGDTLTITDPNAYYLRYRWMNANPGHHRDVPEVVAGQQMRLRATIVSSDSDTDKVVLRWARDRQHKKRARFQVVSEVNNGDGTYTREYEITFRANPAPGFFHAGLDAMTHETIFDDTAPYSVSWWGVPYRVFPGDR